MKQKMYTRLYIAAALLLCLIPSAGRIADRKAVSTENRSLAGVPSLYTGEGTLNLSVPSDAGAWFEDHFAFRSALVTAYGKWQALFGVSAQKGVILGRDGWMYYTDSLEDYQGESLLTERQLFDIAHSLRLMQDYAGESGASFVFAVAPNKNSVYGEYMPYYYAGYRESENNYSRLLPILEEEGVVYTDLRTDFAGLRQEREEMQERTGKELLPLYHKTDSHWTAEGAAVAADRILTLAGTPHESYQDRSYEVRQDFSGDLMTMLYPADVSPDSEVYYEPEPSFAYVEEVESNFAPHIQTVSESGTGSAVICRDSFGNALLPFLAEAYAEAYFTRGVPYTPEDLKTYSADTLIVERAERFLPDMAENPPVMEAPVLPEETAAGLTFEEAEAEVTEMGEQIRITGLLPVSPETRERIAVMVEGTVYEAFPQSTADGEGFFLTLPGQAASEESEVQLALFS